MTVQAKDPSSRIYRCPIAALAGEVPNALHEPDKGQRQQKHKWNHIAERTSRVTFRTAQVRLHQAPNMVQGCRTSNSALPARDVVAGQQSFHYIWALPVLYC